MIILVSLFGCASPGPMQTTTGVMRTPAFRPLALDTTNDGSKEILFKEYTTMYDDKQLRRWGVFFITDRGAYMASWDTQTYIYNLNYQLKKEEILEILDETVVRKYWHDSNLLVIKDVRGNKIGFALIDKIAARSLLQKFVMQNKTMHQKES